MSQSTGPLDGIRIIEFAGLGPAPFAAMVLAGLGADVIRIDRPYDELNEDDKQVFRREVMNRDRRSIALDLKNRHGLDIAKRLVASAHGLLEGFRPGVMERLSLGPDDLSTINPSLTFVRMTGWGQSGPLAQSAGHDLNYIAITGMLDSIGPKEAPVIPLNVIGDFGGGATMAVIGMVSGILKAKITGEGSVVDASIVDGTTLLGAMFHGMIAQGEWRASRSSNLLDGGAPFYSVYKCKEGKFITVAALEPKFFNELISRLGLVGNEAFTDQYDRTKWPEMRRIFQELFSSRDRGYFVELLEGTDACFAPVETIVTAQTHPHMAYRGAFETVAGTLHPRPAPRFENYWSHISPPPFPGEHTDEILYALGISAQEVLTLERLGAFGQRR